MTWSNLEMEYEGFPLLLRRPDHPNIWRYKNKFTQLVLVEHTLEKVKKNGLPEGTYNKSLSDFDEQMCTLLDKTDKGIIFLIETFAGKRNYYYYIEQGFNIKHIVNNAKKNFKVNLEASINDDTGWGFLKEYPVNIFPVSRKKKNI